MADKKITQLNQNTAPLITDYGLIVDDPGGTPETQYIRLEDWLRFISGLTELATVPDGTDLAVILDAGVPKKISYTNLMGFISLTWPMYDGGAVLGTGARRGNIVIPCDCELVEAGLLADQTGSIVVDIWSDIFGNYPPTDADSITASAPLTITSDIKVQDTTLTGWTKSANKGDIWKFAIDSCSTIQDCDVYAIFKKV